MTQSLPIQTPIPVHPLLHVDCPLWVTGLQMCLASELWEKQGMPKRFHHLSVNTQQSVSLLTYCCVLVFHTKWNASEGKSQDPTKRPYKWSGSQCKRQEGGPVFSMPCSLLFTLGSWVTLIIKPNDTKLINLSLKTRVKLNKKMPKFHQVYDVITRRECGSNRLSSSLSVQSLQKISQAKK